MPRPPRPTALLLALALPACGPAGISVKADTAEPTPGTDPGPGTLEESAALFDPAVLHRLEITIAPADWEELRYQDRSYYDILGDGCMEGPIPSPYTWFTASATYDGEELGEIGVRKKGLIGSVTPDRPSLRLDTDRVQDGARFHGLEKLVFNNNNQDRGRLRTCTAHAWFADAGLVAPRCALTQVTVNGEDLGIYSHAEAIDDEMIARNLGTYPAAMYEGTLSDFRTGWLATFEPETDGATGAELEAVRAALEADDPDADAELLDRLGATLDLDAFLTFWAAESIAGHWDGYDGNTNNFYAYTDPATGLLRFVASGPDAAFDSRAPFGPRAPAWVATTSALAERLIRHPEGRARYVAEVERLLDQAWRPDDRLARFDALADLAAPRSTREQLSAIAETRAILAAKEADLRATLGDTFDVPPLRGAFCWEQIGTVLADFSTEWGSYPRGDLFSGGEVTASYDIQGTAYAATDHGASAGYADDGRALWLVLSTLAPDTWIGAYVVFDPGLLAPGDIPVDGEHAEGALIYQDPSTNGQWVTAAYLGGTLTLTAAGDVYGDAIEGSFDGTVLGSP